MAKPATLGEYLRAAREEADISQRQLASRVEIHNSYLARLESGENDNPAAELLQRMAEVLEISPTDLLAFIGVKPVDGLPELAPYLRAKYRLDEAAVRELAEHLASLADRETETTTKD